MACNSLFGIGNCALVSPDDSKKKFTLAQAEIALFDRNIWNLILDIESLHDMAKVNWPIRGGGLFLVLDVLKENKMDGYTGSIFFHSYHFYVPTVY